MIRAGFREKDGVPVQVQVSGHAGYADRGTDIVCASVTSAVQMAANGITEVLEVDAGVLVEENRITVELPKDAPLGAGRFLQALRLHLELLAQDYPDHIQVMTTTTEV